MREVYLIESESDVEFAFNNFDKAVEYCKDIIDFKCSANIEPNPPMRIHRLVISDDTFVTAISVEDVDN